MRVSDSPAHATVWTVVESSDIATQMRSNSGPVEVREVQVRKKLVLRSWNFNHRITFREVVFQELVDLRDCLFSKTVDMRRCVFRRGLILEGAEFDGSLILTSCVLGRIDDDREERSARFRLLRVAGDVTAEGMRTRGGLDLSCSHIRGHLDLSSTAARATRYRGDLVLSVARIGGSAQMRGIELRGGLAAGGVRVGADLDLGPVRDGPPLRMSQRFSFIQQNVDLSKSRIYGNTSFSGAAIEGRLNLQASKIAGGLFCRAIHGNRPTITGSLHAPGIQVSTTLDLSGVRIDQNLVLQGARIKGNVVISDGWFTPDGRPMYAPEPPQGVALDPDLRTWIGGSANLRHANIEGTLDGNALELCGTLDLDDATFTGSVDLNGADIAKNLSLGSTRIKGGLHCRAWGNSSPVIGGSIEAAAAHISSGVDFTGIVVNDQIKLVGARVEGNLDVCRPGRASEGAGKRHIVSPDHSDAYLECRVGGMLDMGHTIIFGSVRMLGLHAENGIILEAARITGYLDLTDLLIAPRYICHLSEADVHCGTTWSGNGQSRSNSLNGNGLRLQGIACCHGIHVLGDVDFQSAVLTGGIDCCAYRDDESNVVRRRPVIGGSLLLRRARIGRDMDLQAAWIQDDVLLERANVAGMLRLRLAEPPIDSEWDKHLCTRLGKRIIATGSGIQGPPVPTHLKEPEVEALSFGQGPAYERLAEAGFRFRVFMRSVQSALESTPVPTTMLNLRNCTVQYLDLQGLDRIRWKAKEIDRCARDVGFLLEGLKFNELSIPGTDYRVLFRGPEGSDFRQSSYEMVEHWLRNQGDERSAERVFKRMRRDRRRTLPTWERFADWLLGLVRDTAMRFQWLIALFVIILAGSTAIFSHEDAIAFGLSGAAETAASSPRREDAFLFALQAQLPMLNFPVVNEWKPARRPIPYAWMGLCYDQYAIFLAALGYLTVPLIVGGIASTWLHRRTAAR